jgi:hypothetical protein
MTRSTPERIARIATTTATVLAAAALFIGALGCRPVSTTATLSPAAIEATAPPTAQVEATGSYVAGDLHTHTVLTDGNRLQKTVVDNAFGYYGLDWMANSEHGGVYYAGRPVGSGTDPYGHALKRTTYRWWELRYWSYPIVRGLRPLYPGKRLIQGVEWNVPAHEHASVGIVGSGESTAVSDFEYRFDRRDTDTSRAGSGLTKRNKTAADALAGIRWLAARFPARSYFIVNHPSRGGLYSIADLRAFNDAAPDVAFGFEGIPGNQKQGARGNYTSVTNRSRQTYGGADIMIARVGGVWDALLGEGRRWWTFADSDFHNTTKCFWPGQYAKSYTFVRGSDNAAIVAGMRSGDSFSVTGGIISALDFTAARASEPATRAAMGGVLPVAPGETVEVTVRFFVPAANYGGYSPRVDHVDVIRGAVGPKALRGTAAYSTATNPSAKVVARLTSADWDNAGTRSGWHTATFRLRDVTANAYIRLRGTNLRIGTAKQTDAAGNPLSDRLMGTNSTAKAWADSWFYSNPIFISVE